MDGNTPLNNWNNIEKTFLKVTFPFLNFFKEHVTYNQEAKMDLLKRKTLFFVESIKNAHTG